MTAPKTQILLAAIVLLTVWCLFSRSYCYTVWLAIGSSVSPSVCLWRRALWLSRSMYRAKSLKVVPACS